MAERMSASTAARFFSHQATSSLSLSKGGMINFLAMIAMFLA
jgi:hypothetical protein